MIRGARRAWFLGLLGGLVFGSVLGLGCKEEGPMERAGATIDEKLDAVADPFDGREGAFEKLGEKVDDASDSVREKIDDAMDR